MIPKLFIGVLLAIVLVLLYRGMRQEQAAVDPMAPLDVKKIQSVLVAMHLQCDKVVTFTPLGKSRDQVWDGYLAICHDGGRYVYFQSQSLGKVGATSCQNLAFAESYRCPE
jgi:hypothetical protein